MILNRHISRLRFLLEKYDSDTYYGDQKLAELFLSTRAKVIGQRLRKFNTPNSQDFNTFCIELEEALSHECGCVTHGCTVLKSKHTLPEYIKGRDATTLTTLTLGNSKINYTKEEDYELSQYNDIIKDKPLYSIVNNRLIIWNNVKYPAVQLRAIWRNILDWTDIQYCADDDCPNPYEIDIIVDVDLENDIYKMILKDLGFTIANIALPDVTNDNQDDI